MKKTKPKKLDIGRELADARRRAGMTQEAVARRMGVTQGTVAGIELRGRVPLWSTIVRYLDAIGLKPTVPWRS